MGVTDKGIDRISGTEGGANAERHLWRMAAKGKRSRPGSHLDPQAMCFRPGSGEVQGTKLKEGPGAHRVRRGPNRWLYSGSLRCVPSLFCRHMGRQRRLAPPHTTSKSWYPWHRSQGLKHMGGKRTNEDEAPATFDLVMFGLWFSVLCDLWFVFFFCSLPPNRRKFVWFLSCPNPGEMQPRNIKGM
jgi:hypothetical protein